jgi:hypothetical protein
VITSHRGLPLRSRQTNEDQAKERGSLIPIVMLRIKPNGELSGLQKGICKNRKDWRTGQEFVTVRLTECNLLNNRMSTECKNRIQVQVFDASNRATSLYLYASAYKAMGLIENRRPTAQSPNLATCRRHLLCCHTGYSTQPSLLDILIHHLAG